MPRLDDDLGHPLLLERTPSRVVSLVPSLTEALAATVPARLVGATEWCTHPAGLDVTRVRGTKNPDHGAISRLLPDLVVANQEENRSTDVERLRAAGVPVWVTVVESVDQALRSMRRLFVEVLGVAEPDWLVAADTEWSRPPEVPPAGVIAPIWRDPWMAVGSRTFSGDILARLGLSHLLADAGDRYPKLDLGALVAMDPDLVLLPDEPYPFSAEDGPEAFPGIATSLVSGRSLTWYGPAMVTARAELEDRINAALATG
ncbi:MAG TPA: helical backbone metal receptor [Acidimicrobiales bacterium]|nr:helical backbone metal receptor [Acidimicrobiales bacterium]